MQFSPPRSCAADGIDAPRRAPARPGVLWEKPPLSRSEYRDLRARLQLSLAACLNRCDIDASSLDGLCEVYLPLAAWLDGIKGANPMVVGISGAQGSGKSTLCEFLRTILANGYGYRVAGFSLDDLYKTHQERAQLAAKIHPLLLTRGVPGTHDVALGISVIDALLRAAPDTVTRIPSFDKATDDRSPEIAWPKFRGPADIILFEGWCVGAVPQPEAALSRPVNELEAVEDTDCVWRRYVNTELATDYARLFDRLNKLILLKVPGFESVHDWRNLQEQKLAAAAGPGGPKQTMDRTELKQFIMHYERLTRAMLEEMPQRADIVLHLDPHHRFTHVGVRT